MSLTRDYVTKKWLHSFSISLLSLLVLISVSKLVTGFLRDNVTPKDVLLNYVIELPSIISMCLPISCLTGTLFGLSNLRSKSELIALLAGGITSYEILFYILRISVIVALFEIFNAGYLNPYLISQKVNLLPETSGRFSNLSSKGLKFSTIKSGRIWFKSDEYYFSVNAFDKENELLKSVNLYRINNSKISSLLYAESATFDKDGFWKFKNVQSISKVNELIFPSLEIKSSTIERFNETPETFQQIEADVVALNIVKLYEYIEHLLRSGVNATEYLLILYRILANAAYCILFSIIPSVIIFSPSRRNSSFGLNVGLTFVFALLFWLFKSYFDELGRTGLVPAYISGFSLHVLIALGLTLYWYKHRKLI